MTALVLNQLRAAVKAVEAAESPAVRLKLLDALEGFVRDQADRELLALLEEHTQQEAADQLGVTRAAVGLRAKAARRRSGRGS
jgi:DNA-directed RNA polymerase specialized sigma24 family protein